MLTTFLLIGAFLAILLQDLLKQWGAGGFLNYFPEFIVIVLFFSGVLLQLYRTRSMSRLFLLAIFLYAYLSCISLFFGHQSDPYFVFAQSFIHIEYFLMAVGCYGLVIVNKYISFQKVILLFLLVTFIGAILNLILGHDFFTMLHAHANEGTIRLGRTAGFQLNADRTGVALAIGSIYLLVKASINRKQAKWLYLAVAIVIFPIYLTASRTAIGIVIIGFMFTIRPRRMPIQVSLVGACLVGIALTQTTEITEILHKSAANFGQLSSNGNITYARWLMLGGALRLAIEHFPLGTGAATFGSTFSKGSNVYSQLGLLAYPYIENGAAIFDSNLATILGEFGFIGFLIFYSSFAYSLKRFGRLWDGCARSFWDKNRLTVMFFLITLLMSISEPVFMNSYYSLLLIVGYIACCAASGSMTGNGRNEV